MRDIYYEEVKEFVHTLPWIKSSGPDRFTLEFIKACWHLLRANIYELVEQSHQSKRIWLGINTTFLMLISNKGVAVDMNWFWPISLENVIYKIISGILVWHLKPLMKSIIEPVQTWFVEGKQIMDGIIVAHEAVHSLKSWKTQGMIIKLDMSKAYDYEI